jgi:hypothetical protein
MEEKETFTCEFCNHTLSNAYNLKYHQEKSVKCLKLQKKNTGKYMCELCDKILSSKKHLKTHMNKCQDGKIVKENETLKETIKNLTAENRNLRMEKIENKKTIKRQEYDIAFLKKLETKAYKVRDFVKKLNPCLIDDDDNLVSEFIDL